MLLYLNIIPLIAFLAVLALAHKRRARHQVFYEGDFMGAGFDIDDLSPCFKRVLPI